MLDGILAVCDYCENAVKLPGETEWIYESYHPGLPHRFRKMFPPERISGGICPECEKEYRRKEKEDLASISPELMAKPSKLR